MDVAADAPFVGIIMGSDSDLHVMQDAADVLAEVAALELSLGALVEVESVIVEDADVRGPRIDR